jgi:uncharacterized protein (DUF2252 family)
VAELLQAYTASLDSPQTPTELLEDDRMVGKMIKAARSRDYGDELDKYVTGKDEFVPIVTDKTGRAKEILRQVKGRAAVADAIADALLHTPDGKDLFKSADFDKKRVEDIAKRTQLESAGSEGLQKFLVLVDNKKSPEKKLILYMKEQIPSSAERVGLIPRDARTPGQRSSEDMHLMTRPPGYFNTWCDWNGGSYRVSIKEPWTDTMDAADVDSLEDLKHVARIWGTVAGSLHRQSDEAVANVKKRLTPELAPYLRTLGMLYATKARDDFRQFVNDPRVKDDITRAETALRDLRNNK